MLLTMFGGFLVELSGFDVYSEKMYQFFMSLKQPDGSFLVAHHAEVDVRYVFSPNPYTD